MSSENNHQEHSIRGQVAQSETLLKDLEDQLTAVEDELETLARAHRKFDVLSQICGSLNELDEMGAGQLFWDDCDRDERAVRVARVQRRIDEYCEEIRHAELMRDAVIDRINEQNIELDCLHYDLQDVIEREESRRNEWVVERNEDELPARTQIMPWTRGNPEDQRYRRSLATSLAASVAIALLLSMIAIPIKERTAEIELPDRVAKLVRQERTPPPPPPVAEPELPDEELPEPEPELVDEAEPVPEVTPQVAEVEQPDTREQVKSKGILAFRDSFASRADLRPTAQLGSQARVTNAGADASGRPERMMVTTSAPGSSGGINLADISRDFGGGGGGMEGVALTRVASSIGGGDGPDRPLAAGAAAGRTDEEIQIVFDRYKAALYRLYNRELRNDPTLRGQLVLRLTIEPDGSVSLCELHSSDMDAPLLADQVVDRVRTFDFGAKEDIVAVTIIYPIDFLPAA